MPLQSRRREWRAADPAEDTLMARTRIAVIVGSLRRDSLNRKLADALAPLMPADVELARLR